MAEKRQLELYLLRFLPHALRDDFVTVGLLLLESDGGFAEVRFTCDWRMLQCVAPMEGRLKQSMAVDTAMVMPLMGRIAAGRPIEAVENDETISLADFVHARPVFALEVRGDSMQDEAILDGDYVLVEKKKTARDGDIVVALIESTDATLKRFFREGDNIRLQPSNAAMKPIIVPAESVQIQGRVIGVMRKY